ncbi:hypothetical protein JCM24511_03089 [Saitozyma sp. JCM 24511]|nr:hypothetical protein JCM24511_03089 [Saitozyma sp. JCM 24511]
MQGESSGLSSPAESSRARQRRKRPAQIAISDDEDELSPPPRVNGHANGKKRRSDVTELQVDNSDLDDLISEAQGTPLREVASGDEAGDEELEEQLVDVEGELEEGDRGRVGFRPEYQRGADGYVAGSVTRIKLHNFMTYDHVEFRPGPHLNMILGPNGTGKSTIAAGIAIGLGFPPKVMGRAHDLKSYVKQGCIEAWTEIELKGRPGKANVIIWRRFNREDDKSEFRINGETGTKKAVSEIVRNFGVQANNLCSFLPQDKVAEFAKMSPDIALESEIAQRDQVQTQVDALAPDVAHFEARKEQEQEREYLILAIHVAKANAATQQWKATREDRESVKRQQTAMRRKRQPLVDLQDFYERKTRKVEAHTTMHEEEYKDVAKHWKNSTRRMDDTNRLCREIDDELTGLQRKAKRLEDEKQKRRTEIRQAEDILRQPVDDVSDELAKLQQRKKEIVQAQRTAVNELQDLERQRLDGGQRIQQLNRNIDVANRRHQQLSSAELQREAEARRFDPSMDWMLDWLEQNGSELESPVLKPPMISVSVKDTRYAWQVEAFTNLSQRSTFICQTQADYSKLLGFQNKQTTWKGRPLRVRLHLAMVEVNEQTCNPPRLCSPEDLADMGMDAWAIDHVEAEPGVIAFLNERAGLHRVAITQQTSPNINSKRLMDADIRSWATANEINRATRSLYGRKDWQFQTEPRREARAFNKTVDQEAIRQCNEEIKRIKLEKNEIEAPLEKISKQVDTIRRRAEERKREAAEVDEDLERLRENRKRFEKAKIDLERARRQLVQLENEPTSEERRKKLGQAKYKLLKEGMPHLESYWAASESTMDLSTRVVEDVLRMAQCRADNTAIGQQVETGHSDLEEIEQRLAELSLRVKEVAALATALTQRAKDLTVDAPSVVKRLLRERKDQQKSVEELKAELSQVEADLELSVGIDPGIIQRYQRLSIKLGELKARVEQQETALQRTVKQINKVLNNFEPALNTLVDVVSKKFSAAFERVGCAGEVRVARSEEGFDKWGIEILVSYRDGDNLAILTGSHQSGGVSVAPRSSQAVRHRRTLLMPPQERSLATVTYLMSLSEMARTPFSLVDEINQGLDQRAERNVHNQLVEVTCGSDAGQYFLITPKLLTGLSYHRKMRVLIVNNGTGLPDTQEKSNRWGDLKANLARYKAAHGIVAS